MTDNEHKSLQTLIFERQELAYNRIKNKPFYLEVCERQRQTEEVVEKMYREHFTHDEQLISAAIMRVKLRNQVWRKMRSIFKV